MPLLFDHDPLTGVSQYFDYDPINDEVNLTSVQDVAPILEALKVARNDPDYSRKGMKQDWWHYATIPPIIEMQLKKKGIDIYDKDATKAILREINQNYPWLKATDKLHA